MTEIEFYQRVGTRNRIIIPSYFAKAAGIKAGDTVKIVITIPKKEGKKL